MLKAILLLTLITSMATSGNNTNQVLTSINNSLAYIDLANLQTNNSNVGSGGGESSEDDEDGNETKNRAPGCYAFTAFDFYLGYHDNVRMYGSNFGQDPEDKLDVKISSASASQEGIVDFYVDNGYIFITPVSFGETWITANIYDSQGASTPCAALFRVKPIPGIELFEVPDKVVKVNKTISVLAEELGRSEAGRLFVKDTVVDNDNIAKSIVQWNRTIKITGISPGKTTVTAMVYNEFGTEAEVSFDITVIEDVYGN